MKARLRNGNVIGGKLAEILISKGVAIPFEVKAIISPKDVKDEIDFINDNNDIIEVKKAIKNQNVVKKGKGKRKSFKQVK